MTGNIDKNQFFLIILLCFLGCGLFAQGKLQSESIMLSGIVVDADEHKELPYINVRIVGTRYGTATDNSGYFSLFINPGDSLMFSSIGYQDALFIMPYRVDGKQYSLMQLMRKETILLKEVVVFPWPSLKSFEKAFLDATPKRSMDDLVIEVNEEIADNVVNAKETEYYHEQMRYHRLYLLTGQLPPNNFLNPIRWSNFIRDVRDGKIK